MNPQLNAWIYTIGWALIHFVWQGGLIALATAAALASCRHRSSETRYAIACAGLVAMLAAPAITAAVVGTSDQTIAPGGSASPTVSTSASPSPAPADGPSPDSVAVTGRDGGANGLNGRALAPDRRVGVVERCHASLGAIRWRVVPSTKAASCLAQRTAVAVAGDG